MTVKCFFVLLFVAFIFLDSSASVAEPGNGTGNVKRCNCSCGIGEIGKYGKIVNGRETERGEFPWHVRILGERFQCGGAVINSRYVLTAAHCVAAESPDSLWVVAREHDRDDPDDRATLKLRPDEIEIHSEYVMKTYENDIALLRLDQTLPFNGTEKTVPICLPEPSDPEKDYANEIGVVTGWGWTRWQGSESNVLLRVEVPIMSNDDCKTKTRYEAEEIFDSMLCAGYMEGGKDSCKGDSGGPLHHTAPSGRQFLIGIVSWGVGCAQRDFPGVYTRVTKYLKWIEENTPEGCYCEREAQSGANSFRASNLHLVLLAFWLFSSASRSLVFAEVRPVGRDGRLASIGRRLGSWQLDSCPLKLGPEAFQLRFGTLCASDGNRYRNSGYEKSSYPKQNSQIFFPPLWSRSELSKYFRADFEAEATLSPISSVIFYVTLLRR